MSDCTDVKSHLAKRTANAKDFKRLVVLTLWQLDCMKQIEEKSRDKFPVTQEQILFKIIKKQAEALKVDLIQLDIKNLSFIAIGLDDYKVGENVNLNTFLLECLISCYASMSEEIPKIRLGPSNEYLRDKLATWDTYITALEKDNEIKRRLDSNTNPTIDRYLETRRDANSLYKIYFIIDLSKEVFERNEVDIVEQILVLQRIFHIAGEQLKYTQHTPNLSLDVSQSLQKMGIPVERVTNLRDMFAHNQVLPLITEDDKQVKELFNDFLIIQKIIKNKIIDIENSFSKFILQQSAIRNSVMTKLTKSIDEKGIKALESQINQILAAAGNVWMKNKDDVTPEEKQLFKFVYQSLRQFNSRDFTKGSTEVSKQKLSVMEKQSLSEFTKYISQIKSQVYDKLLDKLKAWDFKTSTAKLDELHPFASEITQVIDQIIYKDTSSPKNSILDKFHEKGILKQIQVGSNWSLKQELGLYYDNSFKKNVSYAKFKGSNPEKLIDLLNIDDDNARKLIKFLELNPVNIKIQDNYIEPTKYIRIVKDLPIAEEVKKTLLKGQLTAYDESFKNNAVYDAEFQGSNQRALLESLKNNLRGHDEKSDELIKFLELNIKIQDNYIRPKEYERLVNTLPISNEIKETILLFSVEWRKNKYVEALKKYFPLVTIYDNIAEGMFINESVYKMLARQISLEFESQEALKQELVSLNNNIKELYRERAIKEFNELKEIKHPQAVESVIINIFSLLKKTKVFTDDILSGIRILRNYFSHGDPFININSNDDYIKLGKKLVQLKDEVMQKLDADSITLEEIKKAFDDIKSRFGVKQITYLICPDEFKKIRRYASKSCLTWEEIEEFSVGEVKNRDPDNIRIDSEKFIRSIIRREREANEEKLFNLIALADESEVIGDYTGKVNMLTDNHRFIRRLGKVGEISGMVIHGMIAKDLLSDLLRGDYEDLTGTVAILVIGAGLQTAAEVAATKGAGYVLKSRAVIGNVLKFGSPFLSRGVTAFIAWDLYKHVKEYLNGDNDAFASIVVDSVQIGVDTIEIGVEIGEVYQLFEGVSSITGPIGMTIGALLFVGTEVYSVVRTVKAIDDYIHLTRWEKVTEGFRAFLGQQPSNEIETLIDEKDANNQAVKRVTCSLKDNPHIRRYVVPSMEEYTTEEPNPDYIPWMSVPLNVNSYLPVALPPPILTHKFVRKILDNVVLLDEKRNDIKWSRARPGNAEGFDLFCLPKGNQESVPEGGTYYCDSAIGVEYTDNRTVDNTWISLGEGDDEITGFQGSSNIFVFSDGHKKMTGGNKDDSFIFEGKSVNASYNSEIQGFIDGRDGIDTIDADKLIPRYAESKKVGTYQVSANFRKGTLKDTFKVALKIHNINIFLGRKGGVDNVVFACDTKYVDGRGGENKNYLDSIIIPKDDACSYDTKVTVNPYTRVTNNATKGKFLYIVRGEKGKEAYIELGPSLQSNNTFFFDYTLTDIAAIDKSEENITFSFVEEFYRGEKKIDVNSSFNLTISGADKNTTLYQLMDRTKIVIGRNKVYAIQNTEKPIVGLVKDYSSIADKLQMYIVVYSNDEVFTAGYMDGNVMMNDPKAKVSHIVGGGGENVFVISSGHEKLTLANLTTVDVVIYDFGEEKKINTLVLREIKEQLKNDIDREINTDVSKIDSDLLINLSLDDASKKEVVKIRLKDALKNNWYKRLHIVFDNIFVIEQILGDFELTPQPLIFDDNSLTVYFIDPKNVEKGNKIRIKKDIGYYEFARDNDSLVITNPLILNTDKSNFLTIILNDFYYGSNQYKMQTLKIEFDDKTILLRRERVRTNTARKFSELLNKIKIDSNKAVMNAMKKQQLFEAIEANNFYEVQDLIEHGVSIDDRNNDGQTPLHIAALNGKLRIVKYLVEEKHADVNVNDNSTTKPSHCVVSGSSLDVIKYLVRNERSNYGIKPLHYAAFGGNLEVVKYLVEKKHADVHVKDNYKITPLHYAASNSSLNVVRYLVEEKHADVNVKDNFQITPLHYAALGGNLEVVKYLVEEKHADVNVKDNADTTPLHYAASSSSLNVIKYLVEEKHVDVNVKDRFETIPLHYAASRSSLNVVKYLIEEKHADVNVKNFSGITPLLYAALGGNLEVVKYLLEEKQVDINVKDAFQATPLHHAASGSTSVTDTGRSSLGWTLLSYAACDGNLEVVKYLVEEKHVDVNVKTYSQLTPLHNAVASNSLNVVKYLVAQKHAGVNVTDYAGITPLDLAILYNNLEVIKCLVEQGADVNLQDRFGWVPLHSVGSNGLEIVKYLVGNGADVNVKNDVGMTPLLTAAERGNVEMVRYLIEKGARIDIKFNGKTPLNMLEDKGYNRVVDSISEEITERLFDAVKYDDLGEVQLVLNQGVSVNVQIRGTETLLHFAARYGKLKVVKYLIDRIYGGVNRKDYYSVTSLQVAGTNANLDIEKYLVEKGADANLKNIFRSIAASDGSREMGKYLSQINRTRVDLNVRTRFGRQTPLDFAVAGNYSNIVEHLERKVNVKRETPQQHEHSHHHSSRGLLATDSSNQPEIATSNTSEESLWINDLVGSIVKLEEESTPSETASSNHPIRHEGRKRHNDHSRHEDGMRRRVQKRNVKYQDSHYSIDQPEIAASSGTRPSSWINGLVDWIKEKGGGLVSIVADKFAAKESQDPKSRGIHACSVRLEKMYSATIPNIPQSRKSQGVPKGNIRNTSWSGWSSDWEKVTSNVTDAPDINLTVLNNALILGDLAVRLANGTRHKQPIHENLLSPREKSMRFIDENMIMTTIQQGKEKFGGVATNMDEEQDWNWEISG